MRNYLVRTSFGGWREGGGPFTWYVPVWGDFCLEVQMLKNEWGDHRKKNFFINNSMGLSMCDGPIETVI